MEDIRYTKQLDYWPIERRWPGRPLKGLLEGYCGEIGTDHSLDEIRDQKKKRRWFVTIMSHIYISS